MRSRMWRLIDELRDAILQIQNLKIFYFKQRQEQGGEQKVPKEKNT